MPSSTLDFRSSCGCFHSVFINFMMKRAKFKMDMRIRVLIVRTRLGGAAFGVFLCNLYMGLLLRQCGDVELNPGPPKTDSFRQTRLNSHNSGRRTSTEPTAPATPLHQAEEKAETTLNDIMNVIAGMNIKFDSMQEDLRDIKDIYSSLREEVLTLKDEVSALRQENDTLLKENKILKDSLKVLERRSDDLEDRSKRNNIIVHGIPRDAHEKTWEDCEETVREFIVDKLELSGDFKFDRVHRLSGKKDSPIVAKCTFFKDKEEIMKSKGKLKGTKIFLGEDFSKRVRDIRKNLISHMKEAKKAGKNVRMVFDHLIIDGKKFYLSDENVLVESK